MRLAPGDPIRFLLYSSSEVALSDARFLEEKAAELRAEQGLDRPIPVQYAAWIGRLLRFDLGHSILTGRPVATEIAERLPATVALAACAMVIQTLFGVLIGIFAALKSNTMFDHIVRATCIAAASTPGFVIALLLLSLFAVKLQAYEISSAASAERIWLPAVTLGLLGAPQLIRFVRGGMLAEFGQGYVLAALSRGLPKRTIAKQASRSAMLPFITVAGLSFAGLVSGAVVIESIFAWPGIGKYALDSILRKDYPVIQGYALLMVMLMIFTNLLIDALYALIDPRIRRSRKEGIESAQEQAPL
jgi:peptide/nickel transport system permease protein